MHRHSNREDRIALGALKRAWAIITETVETVHDKMGIVVY